MAALIYDYDILVLGHKKFNKTINAILEIAHPHHGLISEAISPRT